MAISVLNVCQVICILGIILISAIFNNYWLLFLLLFMGTSESEERILRAEKKRKK